MKEEIKDILHKGTSEKASNTDKEEMLSLFHLEDKEFELKDVMLLEIQNFKLTESVSPDYRKLFDRLWAVIDKKESKSKNKTRYFNTFLKIAAVLVIGLFIGIYVFMLKSGTEPVYYTAHSPRGSVSEIILPDGSVIFLNAESQVKYSIEGENGTREVFLSGEAWFEVAKNKKKPFVVHTPLYNVNVTGTQFNIKAYETDKEVITTLEEGQVIIQSSEKLKLAKDITLKPGEQLVLNKENKEASIKTVNTKWFTSWKDNKLIFINMNLKELVVLLERKYNVEIEVKKKEILDLHFDGTIKNETIIEIMDIMKKTLPINYKIVGQKIEITDNKSKI